MANGNRDVLFSKASFGGYRPEEVDEYIDNMNVRMESQQNRIDELTEKMRYLVRVIEDMRAKTPEKNAENANTEAGQIVAKAKAEAEKILAKAKESAILIQKQAGNNCSAEKNILLNRQKEVSEQSLAALREFTIRTIDNIMDGCNEQTKKLEEMREQLLSNIASEEGRIQSEFDEQTLPEPEADNEPETVTEEPAVPEEAVVEETAAEETAPEETVTEEAAVEEVAAEEIAAEEETEDDAAAMQAEAFAALMGEVKEAEETSAEEEKEEPAQPEPASEEPEPPQTNSADDLNLDEGGFAELREGISALVEEKYIPGQEEPTIVPNSLQDVKVKQFVATPQPRPQEPVAMPKTEPETKEDEEEDDEEIHFSFFRKK